MGDFNVNFLDTSHLQITTCLIQSLPCSGCVRAHSFSHNSCSLIDLIFHSCPSSLISCVTIPAPDHDGLSLSLSQENPKISWRKVWWRDSVDYELANSMISNVDWDALLSSNDIDTCWATWHSKFMQIMSICIPQAVLRCRKKTYPGSQSLSSKLWDGETPSIVPSKTQTTTEFWI